MFEESGVEIVRLSQWAHNSQVGGSNPPPAIRKIKRRWLK